MTERITLPLMEPVQGHQAIEAAWTTPRRTLWLGIAWADPGTRKPPEKRSRQNRLLHACLSEIQAVGTGTGAKRTPTDISAPYRHRNDPDMDAQWESIEMLPAVDGHGVDIVLVALAN